MSTDQTESNRERVKSALRRFMNDDPHGNSHWYFRASDIAEGDDELSAAVVGFHLPRLRDESPLDGGLVVEEYTERRCGPSLWLLRRDDE